MIEIDTLGRTPEKTLDFVERVSADAGSRIASRIIVEEINLRIKEFPFGGETGLDSILGFIPAAKEGYALNLRSGNVRKNETAGLLKITKPQSLSDFAAELGIGLKPRIIGQEPRLAIYRHCVATIIFLSGMGKVDSSQLGLGVRGYSFWPDSPDIENVWVLLCEVEDATRKMILERNNRPAKTAVMRALHFFSAGKLLAEELK